MFSRTQLEILKKSGLNYSAFDHVLFAEIAQTGNCEAITDEQLLDYLQLSNFLYRAGAAIISDFVYDTVFLAELIKRHPKHIWLQTVEPELPALGKTVNLPIKMLSTEKAYSFSDIQKWLNRIEKAAIELNLQFQHLKFRISPKLDGYAAYDDGNYLYTRGDGRKGTDITRVFERGLGVGGNGIRGQGAGEIVVKQSYFAEFLADHFENARNFQASIIKEKQLAEHALEAIKQQAAVFYPFAQLPSKEVIATELKEQFDVIMSQVLGLVDYDVDGVVIEANNKPLQEFMGATRHHHRWQIAFKNNTESVEVTVLRITPQTSRSGRVNPVAELDPVKLSGALISRASAHHYGMVKQQGIGPGTIIELTRSGLVIPKIERVIKASTPQIPEDCPSCNTQLVWESDYLYCTNTLSCPAQIENTIEHFFKTLGNVDGFGRKTIEKLHAAGVNTILEVYQQDLQQLQATGFGEKTSQNLLDQLQRSRTEAIEDWRFLGAFGIYRMGLGNCERLLQNYSLSEIFKLSVEDVCGIEGFAEKTSLSIVENLQKMEDEFWQIYQLGFNLTNTPLASRQLDSQSPISGKLLVFTGSMQHGSRDEMKKQAKMLGAKVGNSVTGKTDFLVTGEKVGAGKINQAQQLGVTVIDETKYMDMLQT